MNGKRFARGTLLTALCMAAMLHCNSIVAKAFLVAVKADNTRVRTAASTESDVMVAVKAGDQLEVVSEEQGSDGKTWYKVAINGVSGYVRADTVEQASEDRAGQGAAADAPTAPAAPAPAAPAAQQPAAQQPAAQQPAAAEAASSSVVEAIASQAATVKNDKVNVRASASTKGNVVASLKKGAAVTLTGTTSDASGKKWYQVNFINNGSNVTGFIREDLVEPGEVVEPVAPPAETPAEGAAPEEAAPETPAESGAPTNDYELFFEPDADGVNCWYIHDNVAQKRYKLEQLMQAGEMGVRNIEIKDKEIARLKIVLLVLAVLLVAAIAAAAFFGVKFWNARNDDDDDEEEDDEEDEEDDDDIRTASSVRRRERAEQERREAARREDRGARPANRPETGDQRRPMNGGGQRKPEGERARSEAESRRRPSSDAARPKNARPSEEERQRGTRPSDGARSGSARALDDERPRSGQPAPQGRKPQPSSGNAAKRSGGRPDVEWKSKNFLAGDEDDMDTPTFINGDEE